MEPPTPVTMLGAEEIAERLGLPPFRGRQIRSWVLDRLVESFDAMTDLPLELRRTLPDRLPPLSSRTDLVEKSSDGTMKFLVRMWDDALVECVLIPEGDRITLCLSSQVGCPVGCAFCASGLLGMTRNLAAHEILEEYLHGARLAGGKDRVTSIVMMGMGEPLLNYEQVVSAVRAFGISARRITLSTVGLPDRIRRLAGEGVPVNLAVSLHAPDDETRNRLIPVNRRFGIRKVVSAARYYFEATGRDVTFEYVLIEGENASPAHADRLARLLTGGNLNVNLIAMNPVRGLPYRPPGARQVEAFRERLQKAGIPTHIRRPRGREIDGACGQLRLRASAG